MKILYDYQAFEMQYFGGVSRSYAELITHLRREEGYDCIVGIKESDNVHLKEYGLASDVKPLHHTHNKWFGSKRWFIGQRTLVGKIMGIMGYYNYGVTFNKDYCVHLLRRQQFDIFEPTFFDPYYLPYLKGKPFVLTVHDMIPELLGSDNIQAQHKRMLCPLATYIHVPSKNTKDDLIRILGISPERITVIPHGAPSIPPTRDPMFNFPYLLFVGGRWSYKNFIPFITECARIINCYYDVHIVCTGSPFSEEELKVFAELKISDHVVNVPYATSEVMQALYQHAVAFVYPSAYEGFGLPILEAFVNGCPVMLNDVSCFPEIGGDAAIYFDIKKKGDLYDHVLELLHFSGEDRQQYITRGVQRAKRFSWEESSRKLGQIYNFIAS